MFLLLLLLLLFSVEIYCGSIDGKFTVHSKGGNGHNGQDGGAGHNGINGQNVRTIVYRVYQKERLASTTKQTGIFLVVNIDRNIKYRNEVANSTTNIIK